MKKIHSSFHQIVPVRKFRDYLTAEQTDLALETTHLAWVRTTLVMILAGLCISKGPQILSEAKLLTQEIIAESNIMGIVLVVTGTVLLTVITFYFLLRRKQLSSVSKINSYTLIPMLLISAFTVLVGTGISYLLIVT
ncbi:DUF202 domain-containing protein [Flavobacterium sp. AG291]|uniref:DUF202 domain-containing protein n=1 Tax=Flavobacterium sp. AG291 TaxID=2184000 RepID=UPI000E2D725C|nr:DUF202 domain-containing protein [Flavobacterium sp. AG291]RDI10241.1 hypothetical protein DEU42_10857 [Flavobacterium sp. AG291]